MGGPMRPATKYTCDNQALHFRVFVICMAWRLSYALCHWNICNAKGTLAGITSGPGIRTTTR
ncbi:protein of unknown function [Paraburkholderia dioscoreae]|uniref:Uncharacterized protein n=1 Tax=Paraburkholderia dioscoreae TaxID=2604047 RepID=A0A5Q4ZP14_9BURK|nr:protein of unknown function [Paraburkholderia dioscoreae]